MKHLVVAVLAVAVVGACKGDKANSKPTASDEHEQVDIQNPAACEACHATIVDEWRQSMHARAHHGRDPIYAGVRAIRMKKEGDDIAKACARCHTPGFEGDPTAEAASIGVACATCHNTHVGAEPGQLLGPNDVAARATPAHGTGAGSASLADGTTLCMTCHESLDSPTGLSMCATGAEHAALDGDAKQPCAACHMPRVQGAATVDANKPDHASHEFLGPHRAWYQDDRAFAASAISLTATLAGPTLTVNVANNSGHSFPTGFPGRMAIVDCAGRDTAGAVVWSCEPRVLGKKYVDAEGKPTLAPYAETLASDTRIVPGGVDTMTASPPTGVDTFDVTVSMRLVPPTLATKLGLGDAPEGAPKPITTITVHRGR